MADINILQNYSVINECIFIRAANAYAKHSEPGFKDFVSRNPDFSDINVWRMRSLVNLAHRLYKTKDNQQINWLTTFYLPLFFCTVLGVETIYELPKLEHEDEGEDCDDIIYDDEEDFDDIVAFNEFIDDTVNDLGNIEHVYGEETSYIAGDYFKFFVFCHSISMLNDGIGNHHRRKIYSDANTFRREIKALYNSDMTIFIDLYYDEIKEEYDNEITRICKNTFEPVEIDYSSVFPDGKKSLKTIKVVLDNIAYQKSQCVYLGYDQTHSIGEVIRDMFIRNGYFDMP